MKLFFIIENYEPHESGGGYYAVFKFAEFLSKLGHNVHIYSVNNLGWLDSSIPNMDIYYRMHVTRNKRFLRKLDKIISILMDKFYLYPKIKSISPDWILGVLTDSAQKAVILGKKFKIPVANFIYECPPWVEEMVGKERFKNEYTGYLKQLWEKTKTAYLQTDVLFPNSSLSQSYNSQWLDGKIVADPIFPGIDANQMPFNGIRPRATDAEARVLYVGRLVNTKNVDKLILAFFNIKKSASLHICGIGPEKDHLMDMSKDKKNIFFHGFVIDADLWKQYEACDLVVFPSSFEGFGMPPMQALYFGKPCLVSDIPIFRSIYGDYVTYFNLNNVEQLSSKMDFMLADRSILSKKGEEGRKYVLERFSWSASAEKIEKTLKDFKA